MDACLDRAIKGDDDALGRLVSTCHPELRRVIEKKIARRYRAAVGPDDVLQITYLEAFLRIEQFSPNGPDAFGRWLAQIAKNNLRDAIRGLDCDKRPPRHRQLVFAPGSDSYTTLLGSLAASGTTPTRHASREEAKAMIEAALERMPPDYHKAIRLYDLEGQSIDDVAAALERKPGAVHMLRARAHDRLRELLGNPAKFFNRSGLKVAPLGVVEDLVTKQ